MIVPLFKKIPRPVGRLGLELGLGSGSRVVGRLGSEVWVSASYQMFALTEGECPRWGRKLSGGEMSGGRCLTFAAADRPSDDETVSRRSGRLTGTWRRKSPQSVGPQDVVGIDTSLSSATRGNN